MDTIQYLSCDGKSQIFVCEWVPKGAPKGILQISHGLFEHIGRYAEFAEYMSENGFIVVGNDHLGHGRSAPDTNTAGYFGEIGGWDIAVGDMRKLSDIAGSRHPGLHFFMLGHDMGAQLARTYVIKYRTGLDGLLLSGSIQLPPLASLSAGRVLRREIRKCGAASNSRNVQKVLSEKQKKASNTEIYLASLLTSDEIRANAFREDPLCGRIPSASLMLNLIEGMKYNTAGKNLKRMKKDLPVFFFSGANDPFGAKGKAVISEYKSLLSAGMSDVTMKLYHEGRHEMLGETNRDDVFEEVLTFIENKMGRR